MAIMQGKNKGRTDSLEKESAGDRPENEHDNETVKNNSTVESNVPPNEFAQRARIIHHRQRDGGFHLHFLWNDESTGQGGTALDDVYNHLKRKKQKR